MPDVRTYEDRKDYMRRYQRKWIANRRRAFFENKCCIQCGSKENLELDHIHPEDKVSNSIWSWSKERRLKEIAKCQVLCKSCHLEKTKKYVSGLMKGNNPASKVLSNRQARAIREVIQITNLSLKEISRRTKVNYQTIRDISCGRRYVNA